MTDPLTPVRAALGVNQAFHAPGNERSAGEGATFIRNREIPGIWDTNHVTQVKASTPEAIERLLARDSEPCKTATASGEAFTCTSKRLTRARATTAGARSPTFS